MWFKVDDGFHSSHKLHTIPKRQRFGAAGLWAIAGSWSGDKLTEGFIPQNMIDLWGPPPKAAESLVNAGLWDEVRGGFRFRNWDEYQPSREEVEEKQASNRQRQKAFRDRLKHKKHLEHAEHGGSSHVTATADVTEQSALVTALRPDPTRPNKDSSKSDDEFDRWYAAYPRKEAKAAARKAFVKARKSADMDTLIEALGRYVQSVKDKERQYIALPASWLNAGRWEDEYTSPERRKAPAMFAEFN